MTSGITKEIAKTHLDEWLEAELAVCTGQSYTIGSRNLTRANLTEIRNAITYWQGWLSKLENVEKSGGRNKIMRIVPRDL